MTLFTLQSRDLPLQDHNKWQKKTIQRIRGRWVRGLSWIRIIVVVVVIGFVVVVVVSEAACEVI